MSTYYTNVRFRVVLTHIPTGLQVERTSEFFRTERAAYESGVRYMRSRLAMLGYAPSLLKIEVEK